MLLSALKEYAKALPEDERTPAMYARQPVKYVVDLDRQGRFLAIVSTATGARGREARGTPLVTPLVGNRTVKIVANLLMDNAEYALGVGRETSRPDQVRLRHAAFVEAVRACVAATGVQAVQAVLTFLQGPDANPFPPPPEFDPTANVTFRVDGDFPFSVPEVQAYWARINGAQVDGGEPAELGRALACLLCGRVQPALRRIPWKFKNIPGGQTSGTALISANANAFESYGLAESLIAPLCYACAEGFSKGLAALIEGESTHLRRDPLLYVFWSRSGGFSPLSFLERAEPDEVKELLRAVDTARTGSVRQLDPERFYAVSLAGSGGRLAVRDWIDTTVSEAKAHLARFFRLQAVADPAQPEQPRVFAAWQLASATVRQGGQDKPAADVERALYRAALAGGPIPLSVLFAAVRRFRAEHFGAPGFVNRARIALVKLVVLSQEDSRWKEGEMVTLDREERRPAYLCGRLLAVLEDAQRRALGDVNATIVDRFYGSASSTPIAVFGRLLRGAQAHLARLRRDQPPAYRALQTEIQQILGGLPEQRGGPAFPAMLSLRDQGLFALGYYHQRAYIFTRREPAVGDSAADTTVTQAKGRER